MIFLIKHRWWTAAVITVIWVVANRWLGGWDDLACGPLTLGWQIACGLGGGAGAMAINGVLHETFKRVGAEAYVRSFDRYAAEILGRMRWPEFVTGGLMAALAEETFFRGVVLRSIDGPVLAVAVSSFAFAACHWLRPRHFGFWMWAMAEGVLLGLLLLATGSLLVPMIAHGLHDLVAYRVFASLLERKSP